MIYKVYRSSPPQVFLEKVVLKNGQQIYKKTHMPKCDFNNFALQLYWNYTSAWVFSCKFAAYFQNTFYKNTSGGLLLDLLFLKQTTAIQRG